MTLVRIPLEQTNSFSTLFLDYLAAKPALTPYYHRAPKLESFAGQMAEKQQSFGLEQRLRLQQALTQQYEGLSQTASVSKHLAALNQENTFTITTGHQLNIFTGPLYFIFKIATVVDACKQLQAQHPNATFVPVYWMASEDHDLAEINHMHLFGKTHTWETSQTGAVGRMKTEGLETVLEGIPEKIPVFEKAYREHDTLAEAVRYYVNELFGEYGVLVVDADDAGLKQALIPVIENDVLEHHANDLAEKASSELENLGYKTQIFPRKINFFYLEPGQRNRLVQEGDVWQVLNTGTTFTEEQLRAEIAAHPDRFSPNVVLRPLYQELILPNLAYVGGPAEAAYWLQLKGIFDHFSCPFPIIMPRNFGMLMNKRTAERVESLGIPLADFFKDEQDIVREYVARHTQEEISLAEDKEQLKQVFTQMKAKAIKVDPSLEGRIGAHLNEVLKNVEKLEKRLEKAERDRHEVHVRHIHGIKEKLFPNGKLQERYDNFLMFHLTKPSLIEDLISGFDAFDYQMHVFQV